MKRLLLPLFLLLLLASCAGEKSTVLDRELASYRYEQEHGRREDLERLYRQEAARSEDLTHAILLLRKEIAERERELENLRARLESMEESVAAAKKQVEAAEAASRSATPKAPPSK